MRYLNSMFSDYIDFCVTVFWCRWDLSLFNWSMFYAFSTLIVYAGRKNNILFGSPDLLSVFITALFVTIVTAMLALARKKNII